MSRTGLHRALACARGAVVAFLDDDDVVDHYWLDAFRDIWRRTPAAGAATGQVLPYELETDAQVAFERRGRFRSGIHRLHHALPGPAADLIFPYGAGEFGTGANFAVRREVALELGGLDEAFDTGPPLPGGGEIDMMHRVVRHGNPLVYAPGAVVVHRHRPIGRVSPGNTARGVSP
ncbi:MAG: glycosyltransferase family 2 protein [Ilumatobacteraceae bacterium]